MKWVSKSSWPTMTNQIVSSWFCAIVFVFLFTLDASNFGMLMDNRQVDTQFKQSNQSCVDEWNFRWIEHINIVKNWCFVFFFFKRITCCFLSVINSFSTYFLIIRSEFRWKNWWLKWNGWWTFSRQIDVSKSIGASFFTFIRLVTVENGLKQTWQSLVWYACICLFFRALSHLINYSVSIATAYLDPSLGERER